MKKGSKSEFLQIRVTPSRKAEIKRLARQSGLDMSQWILLKLFPPVQTEFQAIVAQLLVEKPSYVLARLSDFLDQQTGASLSQAISQPPSVRVSPYLENYIAAMCELAAIRKPVAVPDWVGGVMPLKTPHFGSMLMSVRLYLLTHSPLPFRRRNIFIDASIGDRV